MKKFILITAVLFVSLLSKAQNKIDYYEYWFDADYAGKVANTVTPVQYYNLNTSVPTTGLTQGLHTIHVRFRDEDAKFSSVLSSFFLKQGNNVVSSNEMASYEYWFDNSYASKVTGAMAANQYVNFTDLLATTGLTQGLHTFHIRFQDATGKWSGVLSQFFLKQGNSVTASNEMASYEYWFDNSYASKVVGAMATNQYANFTDLLATSGLTQGLHTLHIRFQDATGKWSSVLSQFFLKQGIGSSTITPELVEYEYWFDADYAGAQSVAMSSNQYEQVMSDIDALALTNGLHTFHIRFKDASGKWSSVLSQFFLKQETTASILPQLEEYEYWFDTDYASKVNTALSGNQYETIASDLDASALSIGLHTLHIRFKDESTKWSSVLSAFFVKNTTNSVLNNEITAYRYWFDENDAAMVNETVLMPEQYVNVTDAISMVTIPKGTHTIHFQFKDAQGMWSSVTNDTIIKNSLPIANFTADATIFCDNGTVNFDNLSIDGDEFLWEFGDGNTSTDSLATHTYSAPGVYTVSLTAIDPLVPIDSTTTITQLIHVYETPNPTITINGNDSICVGTSVVLSTAPVGIYLWSDNSTAPTLDVNAAGTYSVTVYNIDNSACFAVSDEVEIVLMPLPDASYSFSNVNHLVTFTNTSPEADTYLWNFGDGNTSATTNPTHDYQVNGVYDSYLVAYNFCGSDTAYVTIDLSFIGLSEQILTQELKLYPNPTRSNVWIESNQLSSKGLMIEISNEMGAIVQRLEFNDATSKIQIDMEGFMNGVYYVRITNSMGWSAMEKVILNR